MMIDLLIEKGEIKKGYLSENAKKVSGIHQNQKLN